MVIVTQANESPTTQNRTSTETSLNGREHLRTSGVASSPLRIAWFYDVDACKGATGVTRHALAQRLELARRADVKLTAVSGRLVAPEGLAAWNSWDSISKRLLPFRTRNVLRLWRLANRPSIDRWSGRVDWVYCPAEYFVPSTHARLAVTSHDVRQDLTFGGPRRRALLRKTFERAHVILSVSQFNTGKLLDAFPIVRRKTAIVPNAPDDLFFENATDDERAALREGLGLPSTMPYLLSVANFQPRKNLEALVRVVSRIPEFARGDLALVMIGDGSPKEKQRVRETIDRLPARARVVLAGYRESIALRAAYAEAAALVFPSTCESFGIPAIEAMAQGCPVALANSTALPEIAGDCGWYFDPSDDEAMLGTLRRLLDDTAERKRKSGLGLARASEFRWANSCQRLVDALRGNLDR